MPTIVTCYQQPACQTKHRLRMILPLLILPLASSLTNFPIVRTSYGAVQGIEYQAVNGFVGEIFKKIPFASPPVGELRWKKPVPPEPWNHTLDGTFFGPACAQHPTYYDGYVTGFSEDCLLLNIYTSKACRESNASCPVAIFIHGGNAITGIIMVTVAYRLGVFGAMTLGDENVLPSNLFAHDVLESIRFTRQEIHNFGGDKDQIAIMGHSTGATMVLIITLSPGINRRGEELFARAIAMSASPILKKKEKQVERSNAVAAVLGCNGTAQEIVDCLLPFSTDQLVDAAYEAGEDDAEKMLLDITIAGELMPIRSMRELGKNRKPTKMLLGTTSLELGTEETSKETDYVNLILGIRNEEECSEKYKRDTESGLFDPGYSLISQATFMLSWVISHGQSKNGAEVNLYQFDDPVNAHHGDDTYFVVRSPENSTNENEDWLNRIYPLYFTNFIKGLPLPQDWRLVDPGLMNYYSINKSIADGIEPKMQLGYHKLIADYYAEMMIFDANLSKINRMVYKSPVQQKALNLLTSTESFSISDLFVYFSVFGVIILIAFKIYHLCRTRKSPEKIPILSDRWISNN